MPRSTSDRTCQLPLHASTLNGVMISIVSPGKSVASGKMHPGNENGDSPAIAVCIPVYNDWHVVQLLLAEMDRLAEKSGDKLSVVLIDDGSTEPCPETLDIVLHQLERIQVVHLRRNVGHQRAIALGLCFIHEAVPAALTVVMDADGEDRPADIWALIDRCRQSQERCIVFARRTKRTEGIVFRLSYTGYKLLHRVLVGTGVEVGNFSIVPRALLDRLVGISELWNHYAAAVFHARLPLEKVPLARGERLAGRSKMNFISLVTHGMSAISVYGDVVGVRMLFLSAVLLALALVGLVAVVGIRLLTDLAIPGWATNAAGLLLGSSLSLLLLMVVFVQIILQSRNQAQFLPLRDWRYYVASHRTLHERAQ